MPLQDRAVNVLEILLSEPGLRTGPVAFVCHSLGGLIVKQILLDLQQQKERRPEAKDLLERVTQVVFAATPHTGSRQGTLLDRLRFLAWPSSIARTLVANDPTLRSINVAYRGLADERRNVLQHRIFYETQGTPAGVIVDEASSDPGLPGDPPVPVDANHVSIVKPFDRSSILYARTRDFIAKSHPVAETQEGALELYPLPPIRSEQSPNIVPKLIRIAAFGLVAWIGYKGVQASIAPATNGPSKEQIEQIQKPQGEQLAVKDAQIAALNAQNAALTQMLLEKNPAAGPGAQQAVAGAVQSITQGAAEGDARLQQALDLLKENKIADATRLLNAVAEDKTALAGQETARAAKDRKDAAIAYRNLGAIAGLADPKRALEAYEKAIELDPDDAGSLYWAGAFQIDYGHLAQAQTRLERALKLAETGDQAWCKFCALNSLGDIKQQRGDLTGALKSYQDGLAFAERLAKFDPGNALWQRDLSVSYSKVGGVQEAQGDLSAARQSYSDSFAVAERLAKSDPGNAGWQRDLSVSYEKVGGVQEAQGDLSAALKSYNDSLAIRDRLAKSDPGNAGWQRDLSVSYNKVGDVQKAQGDLSAALKSYQADLAIADRLAKSDPGNAGWQYDLGISNERIGNVQMAQGKLADALKSYQARQEIILRLAKSDPGNAGWQRDLAVSFGKLALVHKQSGDSTKALDFFRQGQAIMARLTKLSPDNAEWKKDLAWFDRQIAKLAER
jgi:tetratricopeptide (TPR) repeat protein